jgi:hypothetical protein
MKNVIAKEVKAVPRRNACPLCGCKDLLTEGPDQFCLSCDWDTCAEYVERGLMNNLECAFREHFPEQMPELAAQSETLPGDGVFIEAAPSGAEQTKFERTA